MMNKGSSLSMKACSLMLALRSFLRNSNPSLPPQIHTHTLTKTHRKWSLSQCQCWKAEWLRKHLVIPSDYSREKTPPIVLFYSDNRPVVGRPTQTKTTLSLSSHSPCCLYPSFDFLCGWPTGISNPKIPEPLPLSLLPSIHPSILSPTPPCTAYIILRLIKETLYGGSSLMGSKGIWLVQKHLGVKRDMTLLKCQVKYVLTCF